jgi:hypothetical protein
MIGAPVALNSDIQKLTQLIGCVGHIQVDVNPKIHGTFECTSSFGN